MSAEPGHIYVDLDSLLDVRLGTLAVHWPEVFTRCLNDDAYYMRDRDDFTAWGGPDREAFRAVYDKRGMDELQCSIMTAIPHLVKDLMLIQERDFEETPHFTEVGMDVNIWPYQMEDWEKEELVNVMMCYGGLNTVPRIISRSIQDMEPSFIHSRYKTLIMYDHRNWMAEQQPKLKPMQLHRISFIAPWLVFGELPDAAWLADAGLRPNASVPLMTEQAVREFMFLDYLPSLFFSRYREDLIDSRYRDVRPRPVPRERSFEEEQLGMRAPTMENPDPTA